MTSNTIQITTENPIRSIMVKKKIAKSGSSKESTKNSLVENINKSKEAGVSRSKKKSTVSKKAYDDMQKGWPKS